MPWYVIASLLPGLLLGLACLFGGLFALLGLLSITVLTFFLDRLPRDLPESAATGLGLSLTLAALHFALLPLGVWTLATSESLSLLDKLLLYTGLGLYFGQVSNSNAHELIHASARLPRRIGAALYISLLHGHHVSAHLRVHHVHAATAADPNSAPAGRGFWSYAPRAFWGEFRAGLRAEQQHRARASGAKPLSPLTHPYLAYVGGAALVLLAALAIGGLKGLLIYLAIAAYAQLQLFLSDYVQHYGLRRRLTEKGKPEPVGPQHSWNAPPWYSSAMMLNAPRHSDHHLRPNRPFPALTIDTATMPTLPHSLPVMAVIALFPPLWRRVMDRRLARWQEPATAGPPTGT